MRTMELTCISSLTDFLQIPFPISLVDLRLLFVLQKLFSEPSALYIGAYFDVLGGRGDFSIHLNHVHPGPPHYFVLCHKVCRGAIVLPNHHKYKFTSNIFVPILTAIWDYWCMVSYFQSDPYKWGRNYMHFMVLKRGF